MDLDQQVNKIKNIIFDLGNVIFNGKAADVINILSRTENEKMLIKQRYILDHYKEYDMGLVSLKEILDNIDLPFELLAEEYDILLHYYEYRKLNEDVLDLAKKLKENGYKVFILSDNCHEVFEFITTSDKFCFFDGNVVSSEYHKTKPNKEIYEIFLEKYNLLPEESFFIDDSKENIEGALKVGIKGHVFEYEKYQCKNLKEDLAKYGIDYS